MGEPDLHLAVALDGAGWHPAAWREPDARPRDLLTAGYWADLVTEAERGLLDLVTIEDALGSPPARGAGPARRRARRRACRAADPAHRARADRVVTHTEPFHVSKAIATLDYVSTGRAGVRVRISHRPEEAALFGRRTMPEGLLDADAAGLADLFDEAADYVEVLRRLWDSWEDDAEIRDAATGRFIDRDKLHYIDFEGAHFSVKGPSITPRPPQGQPVVAALAHRDVAYRLRRPLRRRRLRHARATPRTRPRSWRRSAREQDAAGRGGETVHVLGDLVVFLDESAAAAAERKQRLDAARP